MAFMAGSVGEWLMGKFWIKIKLSSAGSKLCEVIVLNGRDFIK